MSKVIGDQAFRGAPILHGCDSNLKKSSCIVIPNLTSVIPECKKYWAVLAFEGCTNLTSVVISDGVKSIGDHAFKGLCSILIGCDSRKCQKYWGSGI